MFKKLSALLFVITFLPSYCQAAIKQNSNINYKFAGESATENCKIEGIFYDQNKPVVMICGKLYSIGDPLSVGTIIKISPEKITIRFKNSEKEYSVGDSVSKKFEMETGYIEFQKAAPQAADDLDKINSLINDFITKHNQKKVLFDLAMTKTLFWSKRDTKEMFAIGSKMIELIKDYRQQLSKLSLAQRYARYHSLAIKMFDIAEEAWKALMAGDEQRGEILLNRVLRIFQELTLESNRISGSYNY